MSNEQHPTIEQLTDYVHGELPAREDASVHAHVASCSLCADTRDQEIRLGEMLREHARGEELEMPPGLSTRILALAAADHEPAPSFWQRLGVAFRPAVVLPMAAAVALALYFTLASHAPARASAIDAAYYIEDHSELATATMPFYDGASVAPATLTSDDGAAGERAIDDGR